MSIEITPISEDDIETVIALGSSTPEVQTGTEGVPAFYGTQTLKRWIEAPNGVTLAARDEGKLVGFLLGQALGASRDAYINATVVSEDYRGQGIASELTQIAEERFSELGCNHIFSEVEEGNLAMLGLKKKLGYHISDKVFRYVEKMIEPK